MQKMVSTGDSLELMVHVLELVVDLIVYQWS